MDHSEYKEQIEDILLRIVEVTSAPNALFSADDKEDAGILHTFIDNGTGHLFCYLNYKNLQGYGRKTYAEDSANAFIKAIDDVRPYVNMLSDIGITKRDQIKTWEDDDGIEYGSTRNDPQVIVAIPDSMHSVTELNKMLFQIVIRQSLELLKDPSFEDPKAEVDALIDAAFGKDSNQADELRAAISPYYNGEMRAEGQGTAR